MSWKSTLKFFKAIIAGLVGSGIVYTLMILLFALLKLYYLATSTELILSKYIILGASALFIIIGFIVGWRAFAKKTDYYKLFKITWTSALLDLIIAAILAFGVYLLLKYRFLFLVSYRSLVILFIVLFILFYIFSCVFANFVTASKRALKQHKKRNAILFILFNPFFVLAFLWLFGTVVYTGFYIPCAVTIVGIEKSNLTSETMSLGIQPGERIVNIDGQKITTLQDVKDYLNSLSSTKEVSLETEKNQYYVHTYKLNGQRYMGLILGQDYCVRDY